MHQKKTDRGYDDRCLLKEPTVLFLNVNGSGLGHMNRCLAYARKLQGRMHSTFFSLASAIEIIEDMGFEADYFVSPYWSANSTFSWNSELAVRFGMMLERVKPAVVVFDGTWPFQGFLEACRSHGGNPALVWSNRGLLKPEASEITVDESVFDLIIQPGELGVKLGKTTVDDGGSRITVPPVCLLDDNELLDRGNARRELGLSDLDRFVLFSLGPGNLKDVSSIGFNLIDLFQAEGFKVVWVRTPITVEDVKFPSGVQALSTYPLVRYIRAFDAFVGAAGYNTCCEVLQAKVPTLLVPNTQLADDQEKRAQMVAGSGPVVVSACDTDDERFAAFTGLMAYMKCTDEWQFHSFSMNGAAVAADAIAALAYEKGRA